jgi:hypothetical protein
MQNTQTLVNTHPQLYERKSANLYYKRSKGLSEWVSETDEITNDILLRMDIWSTLPQDKFRKNNTHTHIF